MKPRHASGRRVIEVMAFASGHQLLLVRPGAGRLWRFRIGHELRDIRGLIDRYRPGWALEVTP